MKVAISCSLNFYCCSLVWKICKFWSRFLLKTEVHYHTLCSSNFVFANVKLSRTDIFWLLKWVFVYCFCLEYCNLLQSTVAFLLRMVKPLWTGTLFWIYIEMKQWLLFFSFHLFNPTMNSVVWKKIYNDTKHNDRFIALKIVTSWAGCWMRFIFHIVLVWQWQIHLSWSCPKKLKRKTAVKRMIMHQSWTQIPL